MRLSQAQINNFKSSVAAIDAEAKLYLFGSRADDSKRGGDIDLAILSDKFGFEEECSFYKNYENEFEEEKIDLLIVKPPFDLAFWNYVKPNAILL